MPDASTHPLVMLPQSHLDWLTTQPESVLSHWAVREQRHGIKYLSLAVETRSTGSFIEKVAASCLSRNLDAIQADLYDEIRETADSTMGLNENEWVELNLRGTLATIVSRSVNRALFGLPLCRDKKWLGCLGRFSMFTGIGVLVVGQLPPWIIKPFSGILLNIPIWYYRQKALKILQPEIEERIRCFDENASQDQQQAEDFISRAIRANFKNKEPAFISRAPKYLSEQFLLLVRPPGYPQVL